MNKILKALRDRRKDAFGFFEQVYLFGSSLQTDSPNDIDILLIYDEDKSASVKFEKAKVAKLLENKLGDRSIDFTTLNKSELKQTKFLSKVQYKKIKV